MEGHVRFEEDASPRWQASSSLGPLEAAGNPDGKDLSMMCLKCKSAEIVYECDPCGCPSFCRKCAMKVASGGRCRLCKSMYGGVRQLRK